MTAFCLAAWAGTAASVNQPDVNVILLVLRDQLIEEQADLDSFQGQIPTSSIPAVQHAEMVIASVIGKLDRAVPRGH